MVRIMENNNKDFLNNRPVVANVNQYQDVYGSQKTSTRTTVSALLTVIVFILMMIAIITGNNFMMVIFIPLFVILILSFIIARRADQQNKPIETKDNKEALSKDDV